jgi:hypothetical protein
MPENIKNTEDLIDVGETVGADINLDDKGEPETIEAPVEEKIEVEQAPAEDKTFENEREVKLKKEKPEDELQDYSDSVQKRISKLTRKMREAERQREEAVQFAQATKLDKERLQKKLSSLDVGFLSNFRKDLENAKRNKAANINGKNLKGLLTKFKEERDKIERETGTRPQIDHTTQMFMQKILNVWIAEGKEIDEEKFWIEVDYNRQFTHSVEYYERER